MELMGFVILPLVGLTVVAAATGLFVLLLRHLCGQRARLVLVIVATIASIGAVALVIGTAYSVICWLALDEPLYFAVEKGDIARAKRLLYLGADPSFEFEGTSSVLAVAIHSKNEELINLIKNSKPRNPWIATGQSKIWPDEGDSAGCNGNLIGWKWEIRSSADRQ